MAIVKIEEVYEFLGIDEEDSQILHNVERAIAVAERLLTGGIGSELIAAFSDDPRVKELALIYIEDLYSQRGLGAASTGVYVKGGNTLRRLVSDLELQLRTEHDRMKEG